jgi:hypothetical protein
MVDSTLSLSSDSFVEVKKVRVAIVEVYFMPNVVLQYFALGNEGVRFRILL